MSTISERHPQYNASVEDWTLIRHAFFGESAVKAQGRKYLPATQGMINRGMESASSPGSVLYEAYKMRAYFPELVQRGVQTLVGLLNRGETQIELPARLEPMLERATPEGEGLRGLLRKMHEELFITGRLGLLGDVPTGQLINRAVPLIGLYSAEKIINWDNGRNEDGEQTLVMVVLDESEDEREPLSFSWEMQEKYRVLVRGPIGDINKPQYGTTLVTDSNLSGFPLQYQIPTFGGRAAETIPFTFVNSTDLVPAPDKPPLLGLGTRSFAIYRAEADLRTALFLQGQDTLWIKGEKPKIGEPLTGAGAVIYSEAANFIGVSAAGIGHMIDSLEKDYEKAAEAGAQILDRSSSSGIEAAQTLQLRIASRTTTLVGVARVAAEGLEDALKQLAVWVGANPEEVKVTPSLDFAETDSLEGVDLVNFMKAKLLGFPISQKSLHKIARDRNITEMDYDVEITEIEGEEPLGIGGPGVPGDEEDDEPGIGDPAPAEAA